VTGPAELWREILHKRSHFSDHPHAGSGDRNDTGVQPAERTPVGRGAFLHELYACDPALPGETAPPPEGENADPLFTVQLALDALQDAGLARHSHPPDRVALALGYAAPLNAGVVNWLQHAMTVEQTTIIVQRFFPSVPESDLEDIRRQLEAALPPLRARAIQGAYGHALAARVAGMLGYSGASQALDGGSVSAFFALRAAMDSLRTRRCDLALAGAVQGPLSLPMLAGLARLLEATTRDAPVPLCRDADGTLFGEGGGVMVLCRRHDAERQGLRIYALVRGLGVATGAPARADGASAGVALAEAMRLALREGGVAPDTVGLFEAHGSGVPAEDAADIQALRELFGDRRGTHPAIGVGSIKSSFGHTLTAAGLAGMQKAALALYHRILPPSARCERPHPKLFHPRSPFYPVCEPRPWIHGDAHPPRRAGVNVIDFTGVCGHLLLEAHPEGV